jgi:hypothetical protein
MVIQNSGSYLSFLTGNGKSAFSIKKSDISAITPKHTKGRILIHMGGRQYYSIDYANVTAPVTANLNELYELLIAYQDTSGRSETYTMAASQTAIPTVMTLPGNVMIFKNGVYQGDTDSLADYTVTGVREITYSGRAFGGGEQITIMV